MYKRMLDKQITPTFNELINYSGERAALWIKLDNFLDEKFSASKLIRFPYGKDYGWGVKYSKKSKHICDVFAEEAAFSVFLQAASGAVEKVYGELSDYAKSLWGEAYPCKNGKWIDFRVLSPEHLEDAKKIICARMNVGFFGS
jgi:hypothetical protein